LERGRFPCSNEHGPIEASIGERIRSAPRTFPCSNEHGPIEAMIFVQVVELPAPHFRAPTSTAPLKHAGRQRKPHHPKRISVLQRARPH